MSKFHTVISQWGIVSGIRQTQSDMIVVSAPRSPFASEARKGQIIVAVEAEGDVASGRQACELVAQTIVQTFYADGSFSITSSLRSALKAANAALYQHNFDAPPHRRALVGVSCAVIHNHDLFITQTPPSQAFVAHGGKLRALPIPLSWTNGLQPVNMSRLGALGTSLGSEPEFFRSVMQPGDTIVLCSSNIVRLLSRSQADAIMGEGEAAAIAEDLYNAVRSASIPEAHAIVIEAVPGPAPADLEAAPVQTVSVERERAKPPAERLRGWFGRGASKPTPESPAADVPAEVAGPIAQEASRPLQVAQPVVTKPATAAPPRDLIDTLPVADETPLPPSAFLGEGEYGGLIRPPAVPKRNRQIDLSDNLGTPVDFAALPRRPVAPPPSLGERLTMPVRESMASLMGGVANLPRRRVRPVSDGPASGLRLKQISYRRQRPPLPWINIFLIVGAVALLIVIGIQQNRQRDDSTIDAALDRVETAVSSARRATNDGDAQRQLTAAQELLNSDVQSLVTQGLITETRPLVWSRYLAVRTRYDQAMAAINRIGFVSDLEPVATLPGGQGLISRLILGDTATISDTALPLYYVDREAGVLYEQGLSEPLLSPDQEIGPFATTKIREALWREGNIIAFDRGDVTYPIYRVYLRSGDDWLVNQLNATEHMDPADGNLPMATFGGHLYMWDAKEQQIWKYSSGLYANLPDPWLTNRGSASFEQIADIQVDGKVWLLSRDASVQVFEGGQFLQRFEPPRMNVPITAASRFIVTADVIGEDGVTVERPGFIYILDTRNERILQLSKTDGSLVQQIQARIRGPLNQMTDLAVDEAKRMIYIANGPSVLASELPEPLELTPEETVTVTPEP